VNPPLTGWLSTWGFGALFGVALGMAYSKYDARESMLEGYELARSRYEVPMSAHQLRQECTKWWFDGSAQRLNQARHFMCQQTNKDAKAK
jgi:hypothetical protein